jgi:serpin B
MNTHKLLVLAAVCATAVGCARTAQAPAAASAEASAPPLQAPVEGSVALAPVEGSVAASPPATPETAVAPATPNPTTNAGDAARAAAQGRIFAGRLMRNLAEQPGNVLLAPHSVSEALIMTMAGARTHTLEAMRTTVGVEATNLDPWSDSGALARQLQADATAASIEFALANRVWVDSSLVSSVLPEFAERIARDFGAELGGAEFSTNTEGARQTINDWVSELTRQRIPNLLQPGVLTPATSAVLVNAIYFRAAWAAEFDAALTREEAFTTAAGGTVQVPMMHRTGSIGYWEQDALQAISLPYAGDTFEMVIAIAPAGGLDAALDALLGGPLLGQSAMRMAEVNLAMPRFTVRKQLSLRAPLLALGMGPAFLDADFSGIFASVETQIDDVIHEVFIEVTEVGTEAAAATAVVMTRSASIPRPPIEVRLDRPFVFAIRHKATNAVLFMARIDDPS